MVASEGAQEVQETVDDESLEAEQCQVSSPLPTPDLVGTHLGGQEATAS